jgi:hypothetical protein
LHIRRVGPGPDKGADEGEHREHPRHGGKRLVTTPGKSPPPSKKQERDRS